jgi:hypothetical protein
VGQSCAIKVLNEQAAAGPLASMVQPPLDVRTQVGTTRPDFGLLHDPGHDRDDPVFHHGTADHLSSVMQGTQARHDQQLIVTPIRPLELITEKSCPTCARDFRCVGSHPGWTLLVQVPIRSDLG